jgi:hypothetical protein
VESFCERRNEPSGSIKCRETTEWPHNLWPLEWYSAPQRQLVSLLVQELVSQSVSFNHSFGCDVWSTIDVSEERTPFLFRADECAQHGACVKKNGKCTRHDCHMFLLLGLLFDREEGDNIIVRNVAELHTHSCGNLIPNIASWGIVPLDAPVSLILPPPRRQSIPSKRRRTYSHQI